MLVDIENLTPKLMIDLRYKTPDNITGKKLYEDSFTAKLDSKAAEALLGVEKDLNKAGLRLVIWDAYRTEDIQEKLRAVCSDNRYVAEVSNHTKGLAVDVTIADFSTRKLVDMGSDHDEFGKRAHEEHQIHNRKILDEVMLRHGFSDNHYEWWHFDFGVENES
jgi:D-alanyl-D-alanine dipeptidase